MLTWLFTDQSTLTPAAEAGIGVIGFGAFFVFFGCTLFFDRALLAMGNVWLVMRVKRCALVFPFAY